MFHFHKTNVAHRAGLTLGALFGLIHTAWALTVGLGFGQSLVNFVYGIHFMSHPSMVLPFSLGNAILLVLVTSVGGYVIGRLGAELWIRIGKRMK